MTHELKTTEHTHLIICQSGCYIENIKLIINTPTMFEAEAHGSFKLVESHCLALNKWRSVFSPI